MIRVLRVEVTDACPLACAHCSVNAGPGKHSLIQREAVLGLIRDFAAQGGASLVVTGGEPLEYPHLLELLEQAKRIGLGTTLFSMGLRQGLRPLDIVDARTLSRAVDAFRVSIHGSTSAVHDKLTRTPGSFDAMHASIRALTSAGIDVKATFFAHTGNIHDLPAVAQLCSSVGIHDLRVLVVVAQGRAAHRPQAFAVKPSSLTRLLAEARGVRDVNVRLGDAAKASEGKINACLAVQEELVVNSQGWLSPCHSFEPTPSQSDYDNPLRVGLTEALKSSPRLVACREVLMREGGCQRGCVARLALAGASPPVNR